jgi:hypothetical protein
MILSRARVEDYLGRARDVGRSQVLHDVHVSPYEVIFQALDYEPSAEHPGVHSLEGARYRPPRPGPLRIEDAEASDRLTERGEVPGELSALMMRKQYAHIGPRVVADQMALSGIGRSLLIPVVRPGADPAEQDRLMFDIYGDDPRFAFAYCPLELSSEAGTVAEVQAVRARHPLRALKVNANIQCIDVASRDGRARIEHLIGAGRATGLPLVVHGGISRLLEDPRGRAFAALDRLAPLPWRESGTPVVISHAGMFGCSSAQVEALAPVLARLLADNDNVLVDISGLSGPTLCAVLARVERERIVFGSDALYFPQWSAVVKLFHALDQLGLPVEETFAEIAGTNPARHLFCQER